MFLCEKCFISSGGGSRTLQARVEAMRANPWAKLLDYQAAQHRAGVVADHRRRKRMISSLKFDLEAQISAQKASKPDLEAEKRAMAAQLDRDVAAGEQVRTQIEEERKDAEMWLRIGRANQIAQKRELKEVESELDAATDARRLMESEAALRREARIKESRSLKSKEEFINGLRSGVERSNARKEKSKALDEKAMVEAAEYRKITALRRASRKADIRQRQYARKKTLERLSSWHGVEEVRACVGG